MCYDINLLTMWPLVQQRQVCSGVVNCYPTAFEAHFTGILALSCLPGQKSLVALSRGAIAIILLDGHNELIKLPSKLCLYLYIIAAGSLGQVSVLLQWAVVTADS